MLLKEAKDILKNAGYLVETRRLGMPRQVFKQTNDFEAFMNDAKIKKLYNYAVKAKKNSDKELIADGNDPDEYDAIWNDIDESYYDKLVNGNIVVAFVNGGLTVKTLDTSTKDKGYLRLMPANPDFEPIKIHPEDQFIL